MKNKVKKLSLAIGILFFSAYSTYAAEIPKKPDNKESKIAGPIAWPGDYVGGSYSSGPGWESWVCINSTNSCIVAIASASSKQIKIVDTGEVFEVADFEPTQVDLGDGKTQYIFYTK